jgi:hypothetical protein
LFTGVQHRRPHGNLVLANLKARLRIEALRRRLRLLRGDRRDERQRETDDESSG